MLLLAGAGLFNALYLWKIVPALARAFISQGMTFWLSVRINIALSNFLVGYALIVLPLFLLAFIYVGFFWRPEKPWGPNLLLGAAILHAFYVLYIFCMTQLMVVQKLLPALAAKP